MLVAFSVENYRSFREQVTLSMVAADLRSKPAELDANNAVLVRGDLKLVTSAAIYGANASGKSNLIAAMSFMRGMVLHSSRDTFANQAIEVQPFLLNSETERTPSRFEIVFVHQNTLYRYGFLLSRKQIEQEWLFQTQGSKEGYLFERTENTININRRSFKEAHNLQERTRPNVLFLSVVTQWNGTKAVELSEWFANLTIDAGVEDSQASKIAHRFLNSEIQPEISAFIRKLDLGIADYQLATEAGQTFHILSESKQPYDVQSVSNTFQERVLLSESPVIKTHHTRYDSTGEPIGAVSFQLEVQESQGTRRLFALAEPIVKALRSGTVLIVDELDARLHPLITHEIIKLFNSPVSNPHHAQLIFTTHDTNLLGSELFRRDQIWFVEKSTRGESNLYSLLEYRVRNDASFEKNYIQGRYGAIPFIGDLGSLIGALHAETHDNPEG